jgi:hypothetical protein
MMMVTGRARGSEVAGQDGHSSGGWLLLEQQKGGRRGSSARGIAGGMMKLLIQAALPAIRVGEQLWFHGGTQ